MKKRSHLTHLKRRKRLIEEEGFLQDCWIGQYQPGGTAKGNQKYYHLRSRSPLPHGKKSQHLKADEVAHYQKLIANGRELKKIERQLQKLTYKISQREALTSNETNEWYTPAEYVDLARVVMGGIDLDPASNDLAQSWVKAEAYYTVQDNGLYQPWHGRVWLNPPYSTQVSQWIDKTISEYEMGHLSQGILLVKPAVGSRWYQKLSGKFPRCEPHKRIRFINAQGIPQSSPVHGNSFFYIGEDIQSFSEHFCTIGNISLPLLHQS